MADYNCSVIIGLVALFVVFGGLTLVFWLTEQSRNLIMGWAILTGVAGLLAIIITIGTIVSNCRHRATQEELILITTKRKSSEQEKENDLN